MISDRLFTAHLKVFNMANLFDRPMVDAPEKMYPGMKDSVDSRKEPQCGSLWCPMDSRLRGNDKERSITTQSWVLAILAKRSPSFPRRRESIKARQSWNTRDLYHDQQTQRNALHIGVINNLKKWVRVAEVPSYRFSTFFISIDGTKNRTTASILAQENWYYPKLAAKMWDCRI